MKSSTGGNAGSVPRPAPGRAADLRVRALSALVLGPLVLAAVWAGGWVFFATVALGAMLSIREWIRIVRSAGSSSLAMAAYAAMAAVLMVSAAAGPREAVMAAVGLAPAIAWMAGGGDRWLAAAGLPYVAAGAVSLLGLRQDPQAGMVLILFLLLSVWACDIGAYAAGRAIGGPRLAPRISPKKTWAGLVGGVFASGLTGFLVVSVAGGPHPVIATAAGALLGLVSQAGDLFESLVKRRYNVKDSGRLIPGHGGLLDRIDGLMVAAPVLALLHATWGTVFAWW